MSKRSLVVILGATATGKTDISIYISRKFKSEIVSSDSRQIYREMRIGTAMPTLEQLAATPHHMIANHSINELYSSGQYEIEALDVIEELFKRHNVVFLAGGSGLYIDAICNGMDALPSIDLALRNSINQRLENEGLSSLTDELRKLDPLYYDTVDLSNPQRVTRALEVIIQTGRTFSEQRSGKTKSRPFEIIKIGIKMPREVLYNRINRRVDMMIEEGLEDEARSLYHLRQLNALQTVGYRELFEYFDGTISRDEAIELIKRNSRRYAKRQETWFGRDPKTFWFEGTNGVEIEIEKFLKTTIGLYNNEN